MSYRWPWLSSHAAGQQNPLGRDRQEKNQPIENQIRRGTQGTLSLILQRSGGKKHGFRVEGILNVRRVYEVCILNSCLLTFLNRFIDLTINHTRPYSPYNLVSSRLL